jgi:multidrug resistance efflux pump
MDANMALIQRATPGTVKLVLFAVSCTLVTSALLASQIYTATIPPTEAAALDLVGQIRPGSETVVSAPSAVLVRETPVNVGDRVTAGQALLTLDDTEALTALNGARLARYAAAQQVNQLRHSIGLLDRTSSLITAALADANGRLSVEQRRFEQVPVRQWKDSPERAAAAYDQAVVRRQRAEQLFESGIVPKQELDDAVIAVRIAENDFANARQVATSAEQLTEAQQEQARLQGNLTLAEQRRLQGQRNVDLQNAELQLQRVDADLQAATRRFDDLVVRASAAGTVVEVVARPGDRLPAGSMLIRLATLDRLLVQVDVPTTVVNTIRKGQAVSLQLPMEHTLGIGHVRTIAPVPGSLGAHAVDVEFDNPEGMLLVGQTARARFRPLQESKESQPLVQQRSDGLTAPVASGRGRAGI